jgi:hypothetical protein
MLVLSQPRRSSDRFRHATHNENPDEKACVMRDEIADERTICEALSKEMADSIYLHLTPEPCLSIMLEPWGGHFSHKKPVLALTAMGEA